jgi:hypothetical protein
MKSLISGLMGLLVLAAAVAVPNVSEAHGGGLAIRQRVVTRQRIVQPVVRQRVVVQQVVQPYYQQAFVQQAVVQQYVQPVYVAPVVQSYAAPVCAAPLVQSYSAGCAVQSYSAPLRQRIGLGCGAFFGH